MQPYAFAISPYFNVDAALVALFGGIVLGTTVSFKTGCSGGVVGIAGITRGWMAKPVVSKAAFIVGLIVSGIFMRRTLNGFEPVPPVDLSPDDRMKYFLRLAGGGLLVGLGTAMGNGCTSGHGLTGLARLSPRSWAAVPTFMLCAMLVGTIAGTGRAMPADPVSEAEAPTWKQGALWEGCSVVLVAIATCLTFAARKCLRPEAMFWCRVVAELFAGIAFGVGLSISSMMRPSKVAAFLDFGSSAWDPTLGFVMAGGLMVTFPFFQIFERQGFSGPVLGGSFDLPPKNKLPDRTLIAGAAIFGAGWGIVALCPGPIWVLCGAEPSWEMVVVLVSMLVGMRAWIAYGRFRDARAAPAAAAANESRSKSTVGKEADVLSESTDAPSADSVSAPASAPSLGPCSAV